MQAPPYPQTGPPSGAPGDSPSFSNSSNPLSPGSSHSMPPGQQGYGYNAPNGPPYPNPNAPPWGYSQQPQFYPNGPSRGPPNGARFDQQGYQMYPPYYPPYPQLGGPGPGTIQNGYGGGYDGYGGMRYPNGFGGPFEGGGGPEDAMSPPQGVQGGQDHPPLSEGYENGFTPTPNGHSQPPQNYPFYPPNHPYAYGGGVGFSYQPPQNMGYGYGYQDFPSGPPMSGKLNPAAQGFQFVPPPHPAPIPHHKAAPIPPSSLPPASQPPPSLPYEPPHRIPNGDAPMETPTFASIHHDSTPLPPRKSSGGKFGLPLIVDGEKLKGLGARRLSEDTIQPAGSLGLTNLQPVAPALDPAPTEPAPEPGPSESEPEPESLAASTTLTAASSTPAMSSSPTTSTSPTSVQTPKVPTSEHSLLASPKSGTMEGQWTFTGSAIDNSPPPSATVRSFSQAISSSSTPGSSGARSVSGSKKPRESAVDLGKIRLIMGRPDTQAEGNFYSQKLQARIPPKASAVVVEGGQVHRRSSKGKQSGRRTGAIFSEGTSKDIPPRLRGSITFGSIPPESSGSSIPSITAPPPTIPTPPKIKPTSWAALLKPAGLDPSSRQFLRTASAPSAFSASPSPSSSRVPLPDGQRMTRKPSSQGHTPEQTSEPTTPRTNHTPLLPPSTGFSTASGSRPSFNYAAAAAVGAALSPQDELVRILAEGVRTTGTKPALGLARGLINTGNMCFANTVSSSVHFHPEVLEFGSKCSWIDAASIGLLPSIYRAVRGIGETTPSGSGKKDSPPGSNVRYLPSPFPPLLAFARAADSVSHGGEEKLTSRIIFLREFQPSMNGFPSAPGSASGTSTPRSEISSHIPNGAHTPRAKRDASVSASRREAFIPENVYDAMKENKRFDSMREDAEEYLGFFLNTLHEELLYLLSRTHIRSNGSTPRTVNGDEREIERPVSPGAKAEEGWLEVGKKQRTNVVRAAEVRETAISRIFGGTLRSVLHTSGSKDSVTLEPYQPLQLDISDSSDILTALKHLSLPETVPVWSATRGQDVDATKTVYIEKFPPVLILHLKRFVYDPMEQSVVKRGKPVAYGAELVVPPEIISPGRRAGGVVKYKLFGGECSSRVALTAVIYHHGPTATGGHYTVSVSRQDGGGWLHFDDDNVSIIPTDQVVVSPEEVESGRSLLVGGRERCAYLLFYQRVRA